MRILPFCLLLAVAGFLGAGEAEKKEAPPLSPTVQRALETYASKLAAEKQKYLAAALKVQQELRKTLDAEMKTMTQKGNLDGAMAIKAKIEELEKQMVTEDPLGGYLPPGTMDRISSKSSPLAIAIVASRWVHGGRWIYEFSGSSGEFVGRSWGEAGCDRPSRSSRASWSPCSASRIPSLCSALLRP